MIPGYGDVTCSALSVDRSGTLILFVEIYNILYTVPPNCEYRTRSVSSAEHAQPASTPS